MIGGALVAVLAAAFAGPATPDLKTDAAKQLVGESIELRRHGDLVEAATKLEQAYAIEPVPELLAAWGKIVHEQGDCDRAVELFERFLGTSPAPGPADAARGYIEDCGQTVPPSVEPAPAAQPPPPPIAPRQSQPDRAPQPIAPDRPPPRPLWKDPLGGALAGVGGAMLTTGIGFSVGAHLKRDNATDPMSHQQYANRIDRAVALERVGVALSSVGAALVIGGIVRYAVLAGRAAKLRR